MTIAAPFVSRVMEIEKDWIDYNGHLNMAYYNVLFDRCSDDAFEVMGLGPDYAQRAQAHHLHGRSPCLLRAGTASGRQRHGHLPPPRP